MMNNGRSALSRAVKTVLLGESLVVLGSLAMLAPDLARAADEPRVTMLEEVTVTARKREETVLTVPIAITALSAEDLERAGITSVNDLNAIAPGLNFQGTIGNGPGGRAQGTISFRGMVPTTGTAREASGSLFVDGMFVSAGLQSVDMSDVERVEVLRGPQNAYFGRSTFGGAINLITRTPGDELGGGIDVWGASRDAYGFSANVEGGLIEGKLTGRLQARMDERGAQYTAADGGALGEQSTKSITGTLYATPNDNLWIRARAHLQQDDDGPFDISYIRGLQYGSLCPGETFHAANADGERITFQLSRPYFCKSNPLPSLGSLPKQFMTANTDMFPAVLQTIGKPTLFYDMLARNSTNNRYVARAPHMTDYGLRRDVTRLSLQSEYAFENGITLSGGIGYDDVPQMSVYDVDRSNQENAFSILPELTDSLSAELRLTSSQEQRLRWMIGASYFEQHREAQQIGYQINVAVGQPLPVNGFANTITDETSTVPAMFVSVDYDILDNLTVGGELRYQEDETENVNFTTNTKSSFSFDDTLPRVFVRYEPIPDLNLYATWGKGVALGQLNGNFANFTESQKEEVCAQVSPCGELAPLPKVENYELGIKQRLLEGRLQYALSIYQMDWTDINTGVSVIVSTSPFVLGVIAPNDATMKGVEFEADMLITEAWSVGMTLNFMENTYDEFFNATLATLTSGVNRFDGNELPKAPSETASLTTTYNGRLGSKWSWFVRGDVLYTGKMWDSEANIFELDDYATVNARLGFHKDDGLGVDIYASNLFDDDAWTYASRSTSLGEPGALLLVPYGTSPATTVQGSNLAPIQRREVGVRLSYRF